MSTHEESVAQSSNGELSPTNITNFDIAPVDFAQIETINPPSTNAGEIEQLTDSLKKSMGELGDKKSANHAYFPEPALEQWAERKANRIAEVLIPTPKQIFRQLLKGIGIGKKEPWE